ncbi:hypothetical protein D5S18_27050 [Nocardia panacis]|uniref:Aminoacyl-transfer RNA synthetases class-II family profile domain-containing protein n=1 Tax=Nocardia panacis TaxID=2340916 RepID=A0A3A4JPB3_9NOCA|nr:hypothetical protein D5S18_27050 [Nocardia panacis]
MDVRLDRSLPAEFTPELKKRLFFISHSIEDFELVGTDGATESVRLTLAGGDAAAIAAQINRVVADEILTQRALPPRVAWQSPIAPSALVDPFPQLVAAGAAFTSGEGQIGFGEPLVSLFDYLDRRLRAIALGLDNAAEYRYPTLLPTAVLERFHYFSSFPQFAMFVTRLHNDIDVYRTFTDRYRAENRVPDELFDFCANRDYCLPPTMCYHSYHQHTGHTLDRDTVLTARGKSFRFESRYHAGLERLWDFTIREIVFLGSPEHAARSRDAVMRQSFALMEELGLAGRCEVASDHFFGNAEVAERIFSQRMMELKFELLLPIAPGRFIAAGSFNLHGRFFGESFDIDGPDGGPVSSGCVGFGLERLAYAFLCQHGIDTATWPESVRREIG